MTDLPQPLTPADCELRNFPRMPFDIARLRRSKAWLIAKRMPETAFFMMNLWMASWHEKPAASLEDDDDVLADLAMCDPKRWKKIKVEVMRGWIKCADGRLYHSVVAEMANEAWFKKVLYAWKKECDRIRKANKIRAAQGLQELEFPTEPEQSTFGIPKDVSGIPEEFQEFPSETALKGKGEERESKGRGKGEEKKGISKPSSDDLPVATPKVAKPKTATGSRLPADWKPNKPDIDYCRTERPELLPSKVAANFYDYWIAKPGAAGRKLDWSATWRMWVRKESAATAGRAAPGPNNDLTDVRRQNTEEAMRLLGIPNPENGVTIDAE